MAKTARAERADHVLTDVRHVRGQPRRRGPGWMSVRVRVELDWWVGHMCVCVYNPFLKAFSKRARLICTRVVPIEVAVERVAAGTLTRT